MQDRAENSSASIPASKPIRALQNTVDLPPSAFALPGDGRQQKHLCLQRKTLAVGLARYANADGSGACPAAETLAKAMGCDRTTVFRLMKDLETLGYLSSGELAWRRGPRTRSLHVAKMRLGVATSPSESHLRDLGVASSRVGVASSPLGVASSRRTGPLETVKDREEEPGEPTRARAECEDTTPTVENPPPNTALAIAEKSNPQPTAESLAREFCQYGGIPLTPANVAAIAAAITAESGFASLPLLDAAQALSVHVNVARDKGTPINRFFFEDAKWRDLSKSEIAGREHAARFARELQILQREEADAAKAVGKCQGCGRPKLANSLWTDYCADSCRDAHEKQLRELRRDSCQDCSGSGWKPAAGRCGVERCDHLHVLLVHRPPAADRSSSPEPKREAAQ